MQKGLRKMLRLLVNRYLAFADIPKGFGLGMNPQLTDLGSVTVQSMDPARPDSRTRNAKSPVIINEGFAYLMARGEIEPG